MSPELIAALMEERMPTEDLAKSNCLVWAIREDDHVMGYVGLETYAPAGLLRSLVVLPPFKGRGVGKCLVEHVLRHGRSIGLTELWLLTNTAGPFFEKLTWQVRARSAAPQAIAQSDEFASLCPASATCMSLNCAAHTQ
jgi:amino-acid N-acetyltransferase